MSSPSRSLQRNAVKVAKSDARNLFREALREGGRVEMEIKAVVNSMNFFRRLAAAVLILLRRWK